MRQLNSGNTPIVMNKIGDSFQHRYMFVFPNSEIVRRNSSFGRNGSCFGKDKSRTADRSGSEMNKMPVIRKSING
jgi:hypothetical protein